MLNKKLWSILLLLACIQHAFAGEYKPYYSDAGSWNTFNINYGLTKKFTFVFTEELRFRENYSRLNLLYTNIGIEYKASKYFKTAFVYRWVNKYLEEDRFSFRHRLTWDGIARYPTKKLTVSYRHRIQVEWRNIMSSASGNVPEWYSRSKFEIGYNINKKVSPYVSAEFRYQLNDTRSIESQHTWHRSRWAAGVDYQYSQKSKFGIYYLIQREYNVSIPENLYITGLEYSLSLNKK